MVNSGEYCYPTAPNTDTETVYKELFNLGSVYTCSEGIWNTRDYSSFFSRDQLCDERPLQDMDVYIYIYMNIGYI